MRFSQYLVEDYVTMGKGQLSNRVFTIFKNPDKKEFYQILKEQDSSNISIRFTIDMKKEDVYFFTSEVTHHDAALLMRLSNNEELDNDLGLLQWRFINGEVKFDGNIRLSKMDDELDNFKKEDILFLKPYFGTSSYYQHLVNRRRY